MKQREKLRPYFLLAALAGALFLVAQIFVPFFKPLALAMVFAVVLHRLYKRICRLLGPRQGVAAFLTVLISVFLILLPLVLVVMAASNEARSLYLSFGSEGGRSAVATMFAQIDGTFGGSVPG